MKKLLVITCAALTAACVAEARGGGIQMTAAAEADLNAELAGRRPGPAVGCVMERGLRGPRAAGPGVLVFDGIGSTLYVNRTRGNCGNLQNYRSVNFRSTSGQLCRGDVAQTFDPYTGVQGDFCTLGDFEPYYRD